MNEPMVSQRDLMATIAHIEALQMVVELLLATQLSAFTDAGCEAYLKRLLDTSRDLHKTPKTQQLAALRKALDDERTKVVEEIAKQARVLRKSVLEQRPDNLIRN